MIEEITIKFGTELKPTQNGYKLQLYNLKCTSALKHKEKGKWIKMKACAIDFSIVSTL